jgi:hypothetical protein
LFRSAAGVENKTEAQHPFIPHGGRKDIMATEMKDRTSLLHKGVGIAGEYQRAKCAALRTDAANVTFEEELRRHCPRFDMACKDWYEWLDEFRRFYQGQSKCLWEQPIDWNVREY